METNHLTSLHVAALRPVLETALDAVVVIRSDGIIAAWNAAAEQTFGWSVDEAMGQSMAELIVPVQHRDAHCQGLSRYLTTGEEHVLNRRIEITALKRSGEEIPVELSITRAPFEGKPLFIGFLRDISERRKAVALIARQARESQLLFEITTLAAETESFDEALQACLKADTGEGIPVEKQNRLFKQFTQADSSVSREHGGTGLGLAISKSLVEIMDGKIGVVSSEGAGSTFWFELDLPVAEEPIKIPISSAETGARTGHILLAEDLPINQELACAILSRAGHSIDVASNGLEAFRMVQTRRYDLVLMDIQMPKMDGITATLKIRNLEGEVRNIPIVAMTANVLPEQLMEFKRVGMDGHIAKPVKQPQLHSEIQRILAGRNAAEASTEEIAAALEFFDAETYAKIATLLPHDRLQIHLSSFSQQLRTLFSERDPEILKATAHKLISQSGMLGFMSFSQLCRDLEEACGDTRTPDTPLAAAQLAADEVLTKVAELLEPPLG